MHVQPPHIPTSKKKSHQKNYHCDICQTFHAPHVAIREIKKKSLQIDYQRK